MSVKIEDTSLHVAENEVICTAVVSRVEDVTVEVLLD